MADQETVPHRIALQLADVDGTLVTEEKILTESGGRAVGCLHAAGVDFAVTSGRPPRGHPEAMVAGSAIFGAGDCSAAIAAIRRAAGAAHGGAPR